MADSTQLRFVDACGSDARLGEGLIVGCQQVRQQVFVGEQGVSLDLEIDGRDPLPSTHHLLALELGLEPTDSLEDLEALSSGKPVGTGRLLLDSAHPGSVHLGRLAVLSDWRGRGLGSELLSRLEQIALREYGRSEAGTQSVKVVLSAQLQALDFYTQRGYMPVREETHFEAGIEHLEVAKVLAQ
ncbi:hypothetical protein BSR28_05570 [Boudabousia liubingyangii]|uniref:GNAT family N-acetyltransferase n=1 Tax=Boudabousia liubingyangii TaxID=1921764 RepID=UPI00093D4625|nr:GNAT family N-acetyltransferase [Boudabousia liubingyangii]OKL46894.1 hypothetical protein BSR28_05570 [Boudabousia liubingyangii]